MSKVKIYGIVNPISKKVFYVGASVNPKARFEIHKNGAEWGKVTFKYKQVKQIKAAGLVPELIILEVTNAENAKEREQHYIDKLMVNSGTVLRQNKSGYACQRIKK